MHERGRPLRVPEVRTVAGAGDHFRGDEADAWAVRARDAVLRDENDAVRQIVLGDEGFPGALDAARHRVRVEPAPVTPETTVRVAEIADRRRESELPERRHPKAQEHVVDEVLAAWRDGRSPRVPRVDGGRRGDVAVAV